MNREDLRDRIALYLPSILVQKVSFSQMFPEYVLEIDITASAIEPALELTVYVNDKSTSSKINIARKKIKEEKSLTIDEMFPTCEVTTRKALVLVENISEEKHIGSMLKLIIPALIYDAIFKELKIIRNGRAVADR